MLKRCFVIFTIVFLLFNCAAIFNGTIMPNQCKKCEVVCNGNTVEVFEGCGSENTKLYEKAVVNAYENDPCNSKVVCESWRKDPEEKEQ